VDSTPLLPLHRLNSLVRVDSGWVGKMICLLQAEVGVGRNLNPVGEVTRLLIRIGMPICSLRLSHSRKSHVMRLDSEAKDEPYLENPLQSRQSVDVIMYKCISYSACSSSSIPRIFSYPRPFSNHLPHRWLI